MSDDRDRPGDLTARPNRVRAPARGEPRPGPGSARRGNLPPTAAPSQPAPIAWPGSVQPVQTCSIRVARAAGASCCASHCFLVCRRC